MTNDNNLRIFLVDDDAFCMNLYTQHLGNAGYTNITGFSSGQDCLDNLTQNPDVIFLDHGMDTLTGLEVLKKIRKSKPEIFVVFLSGQANITTAVKALRLGAVDYIVKGINELENISKVLGKIAETRAKKKNNDKAYPKKMFSLL